MQSSGFYDLFVSKLSLVPELHFASNPVVTLASIGRSVSPWGHFAVFRIALAVLSAIAVGGILVSPAVPSPPTVLAKVVSNTVTLPVIAFLPVSCILACLFAGMYDHIAETFSGSIVSLTGFAVLPLRR